MKHSVRFLFSLLCLILASSLGLSRTDTLTVLHFNDTHSNLAPIGPRDANLKGTLGGVARAATLIGMTKLEDPNAVVLHAGDSFVGDIFFNKYFGVAEFQLMNAIGFDAMAVGNHEFDLTPAILKMACDTAFKSGGFPLLSANIFLDSAAVQPLKQYIHPYTVRQAGNVKVGIFGLTTPMANVLSFPSPAVFYENVGPAAAAMVDTLKAKGCNVIICLSHLGVLYDQDLACSVPGINVIVGGHDHLKFDAPIIKEGPTGDTCYVVQANAFYLNAGKLRLTVNAGKVRLLDYHTYALDGTIPEDPTVQTMVNGLIADIESTGDSLFTKRIGYVTDDFEEVAIDLTTNGYKDTPIGNLVTDAFREMTGTDIALEVGGATAEKLYKGSIVADDLFRVVGYGFNEGNGLGYRLATMKMTGVDVITGLEVGLSAIEIDDENLVQASGLTYVYKAGKPVGSRVTNVMVGGNPIDPAQVYTVTTNEFVAGLLGYYGVSYSDLHVCTGDTTEFQTLARYVALRDTISPEYRHSITSPVVRTTGTTPKSFALKQNYPNPFNPSTTIAFELPKESYVTLKVFNILGQEVLTAVDEVRTAGKYSVHVNASRLSSGMYFYQLRAGDFVQTRKMMVLK